MRFLWTFLCVWLAANASPVGARVSVDAEKIAAKAKQSVVVVTVEGRDGREQGQGTGFVISDDGLVATNLHVIGEARPVRISLADGRTFKVRAVHASDQSLDLAVLKIDAKKLSPLKLAEVEKIPEGRSVVVMGNPHGLRHSVVSGVVSGTRELDGRKVLQLAIPIEPGNSGGPVLDGQGHVLGIVAMKSTVSDNLGFAVPASDLKALLDKPNPIPMKRWLTIGALDSNRWSVVYGADWRQRAGMIHVREPGEGFGGR
ncbi:MAG: trypsin-like peptidase domain-containing protein, partial [Phycisphaeraceae bacterium]|nr:trypsin-like peptidase domain-containing protein [Phycisphaeraceae bacterium]